jgi:serine/threonine protein kinase
VAVLQPGSTISCYQLIKLLGEGGMGEVWQAHDTPADRPVALKFIRPELVNNTQVRTRFLNEAKTHGKLEHDRIVPLYAVLEEGDRLAFVLRFIEGQSLADVIRSHFPLSEEFVLSSARDILHALGYAHQHGVIHRDVKPQNVLVDREGRCFLTDFGIAVADFLERATVGAFAIGTPHYMSPEQIIRPRDITIPNAGHLTDIYSYGVVLFQMLTGQVPFGQNSGPEEVFTVQQAHCQYQPPAPRSISPTVSPAMEAVVLHCLEKDPARRPQTCAALLSEIEAAMRNPSVVRAPRIETRSNTATILEGPQQTHLGTRLDVAHSPTQLAPSSPSVNKVPSPSRRPALAIAGAAAAVLAVGLTVGFVRGWFSSNSPASHTTTQSPTVSSPPSGTRQTNPPPVQTHTIPTTKPHVPPGGGSQQPTPQPPAPDPRVSEAARQAGVLARQADQQYQDGHYCAALASLDKAIDLFNQPAYAKLRPGYVNGCNQERTN